MSNSTDPVATLFPLLASKGERPKWIPRDWDSAAWPKEPTREAVLQFLNWLLLCEEYPDSLAKQQVLQRIGRYRDTLLDVRNVLLSLQEQGIATVDVAEPAIETDRKIMLDRLRELRVKLMTPAPADEAPEKKRRGPAKRKGRPKASAEQIKRDAMIAEAWKRAHESGVYKPEFARDNGMTISELDALLNRVRMRSNRSH